MAGDPEQAHARRGAHWTFDAPAFVACVRSLKQAGGRAAGGDGRHGDGEGDEPGGEEEVVAVPSFAHGAGDPEPHDIRVTGRHRVVLVEGNYLLLGEASVPRHLARIDSALRPYAGSTQDIADLAQTSYEHRTW